MLCIYFYDVVLIHFDVLCDVFDIPLCHNLHLEIFFQSGNDIKFAGDNLELLK